MIAFWTGAGGWIVVMGGALNTIPVDSSFRFFW
jgi:multiple sugar transport system permease protein